MSDCRVVVIGAGMGGLSAALLLASRGVIVTVLEMALTPGGKMRRVEVDGATIDVGPTVLTMRSVFDALASDCGTSLEAAQVTLRPLDVLARHAWSDGSRLDLVTDMARNADAIREFAGTREADGYLRFARKARSIHEALDAGFMRASRPNPFTLTQRLGWRHAPKLLQVSPFATLWSELGKSFRDPRLHQLFGRYATYCGGSPFESTAVLALVADVEREGVWAVDGGMYGLAEALVAMGSRLGVTFRFGAKAARIVLDGRRAVAVDIAGQERLEADAIVFAGDPNALAEGTLGAEVAASVALVKPRDRSLSAWTYAMRAQTSGMDLTHHNVFFGDNYRAEFSDIRDRGRSPAHPSVYVCAQSGAGSRGLFCIVNAPATDASSGREDRAACEDAMFRSLQRCGLSVRRRQTIVTTSPEDFACMFPGSAGALYGRAPHGWRASFQRPGSRTRVPGLYLAGGATHPGPGVPMAVLSGRQAARVIIEDLASIRSFKPAVTPGGTWTPSATTG